MTIDDLPSDPAKGHSRCELNPPPSLSPNQGSFWMRKLLLAYLTTLDGLLTSSFR